MPHGCTVAIEPLQHAMTAMFRMIMYSEPITLKPWMA